MLRLFLLHFRVLIVLLVSCVVDVFPSDLVCNPDMFSLNRFMTFEHWYTTGAFINPLGI